MDNFKDYSPQELVSKVLEWEELHNTCGEELSNLFALISLIKDLPSTSVRNETTFSTMKLAKGKRRAHLNNETLDDLLMINLESSKGDQYGHDVVITKWMCTKGKRRLNYKRAQTHTPDIQATTPEMNSPQVLLPDVDAPISPELVADTDMDADVDYDTDSDVEQTERENDSLLNIITEYEYELE
ncbi:uncharacterized protein LOC125650332 [Ostrea edulis]|uniref:uncharacterized protein LOC125650332 n=1 Tax=Ostrea edulis TaxID=37623 RepID=UPI0024AEEA10|nr:uncharacterized protein LOC125650332 [Ostrea edulis]XP_056020830.1 uncharacterized protein LOC125650332 [Ostrea edulis]